MNTAFPTQSAPIKLYRHPLSGHSHRVELMLSLLDLPYQAIDVDLINGAHKASEFLAINPFGQVPAIDDNGTLLSDSNAILVYLEKKYNAEQHPWWPQAPEQAAQVQRWLSVAAGELANGPAAARLVKVFQAGLDYDHAKTIALSLLKILDAQLTQGDYLVGEHITLADVALYTYIAHAPEGGISLEDYPAIRAWLTRIESQPRFIGMVQTPLTDA